jgi:hypothetical protein
MKPTDAPMASTPHLEYMPQKVIDYQEFLKRKEIEKTEQKPEPKSEISVIQIPFEDKSSKVLLKETPQEIRIPKSDKREKREFLERTGVKRPGLTERPTAQMIPEPPKRLLSKNDIQSVMDRLRNKVAMALDKCDRIQTPPVSTNIKENRKIKTENIQFLTSGVYWYGIEIIDIIRGLIRYANYNPDLFGEKNYKLTYTLDGIDELYPKFKNKLVKNEDAVEALLNLVGITEIILSSAPVLAKQKIMEPSIESTKVRV